MLRDIYDYPDGSKRKVYDDWTYKDYDEDGFLVRSGSLSAEHRTPREQRNSNERDGIYAQNKALDAFLDRFKSLLEEADNLVQTRGGIVSEYVATEWKRKIKDVELEVKRKRRPESP